jgi:hypothetical protein
LRHPRNGAFEVGPWQRIGNPKAGISITTKVIAINDTADIACLRRIGNSAAIVTEATSRGQDVFPIEAVPRVEIPPRPAG